MVIGSGKNHNFNKNVNIQIFVYIVYIKTTVRAISDRHLQVIIDSIVFMWKRERRLPIYPHKYISIFVFKLTVMFRKQLVYGTSLVVVSYFANWTLNGTRFKLFMITPWMCAVILDSLFIMPFLQLCVRHLSSKFTHILIFGPHWYCSLPPFIIIIIIYFFFLLLFLSLFLWTVKAMQFMNINE